MKHVLETKMKKVDRLSKKLDWKVGVEKDNKYQTLIKEQYICNLVKVVIKRSKVEILEKIKIARAKDKEVVKVVEEMKNAKVKVLWGDEWQVEGNLVLKERKVYIPKNEELRVEIIQLYYDVLVVEHGGR